MRLYGQCQTRPFDVVVGAGRLENLLYMSLELCIALPGADSSKNTYNAYKSCQVSSRLLSFLLLKLSLACDSER